MSLTPSDRQRRLAAKRNNERVKLTSQFLNALGIGVVGASFIVPGVVDLSTIRWGWFPFGFCLHLLGRATLQLLRSED